MRIIKFNYLLSTFNRLSLKLEYIIHATLLLAVCGAVATLEYDDSEGAAVAALAVATGGRME